MLAVLQVFTSVGFLLQAPLPADIVLERAMIWSDGLPAFVEFAAIRNGVFVHVGDRDERFIDRRTERIDAGGHVVIPGLIDSHIHMLNGGLQLSQLQLRDAVDKADFVRRVEQWAASRPEGAWVLGGRWSVESWDNPQQPTREWIDGVTGDRPAFLTRMDGHSALVNSAALKIAGITADVPESPIGGVIERDPRSGEPTGILRDAAMALVTRHIPPLSLDDEVAALRLAIGEALRHGITTVSDIPDINDLDVYRSLLEQDGRVSLRFFLYPTAADWQQAARIATGFPSRRRWMQINGFKAYVDGSLGSRTAWMFAPYDNNEPHRAGWCGLERDGVSDGRFHRNIAAARDTRAQVIAHAIGDRANEFLLNALTEVFGDDLRTTRCRSEHAQHLRPEEIASFGALGVIASMQPYHKADDGRYAEAYLGAERCRSSYAYRSLLDAGAVVAFGSDWPVVTLNPFLGIEAAVTGRTLDGKLWQTQENITVGEALRCYTSRAAYAVFAESDLGRIAPGYRADFVILNQSPFGPAVSWSEIRPVAAFVEGVQVFAAD
jgi:predicted amidohydrolase YtcJ